MGIADQERGCGSLLLFPGALGDAVCLEPTATYLARRGPVTLYARGAAARVATLYRAVPTIRSLDAPEVARLFAPRGAEVDLGWLGAFARIVSFTGASVAQVVARLEGTGRATVSRFPRPPLEAHASDCFLRAASGDPAARAAVPRLVAPGGDGTLLAPGAEPPFLVLFPGSGGEAKRAPASVFAELAMRWQATRGGDPVVLLGPAEAGEARTWQGLGRLVVCDDVRALADLLTTAEAFAGNDSGPSHVAAALGVPGIVFFTATRPRDFGPRGPSVAPLALPGDASDAADAGDLAWAALRGALP